MNAMTRQDTALLVGNGLALDLARHAPRLELWDTRKPLSWPVRSPASSRHSMLDHSPNARELVEAIRATAEGLTDFEVFAKVMQIAEGYPYEDNTYLFPIVELRHYLAIAFSSYHMRVKEQGNLLEWRWTRYLRGQQHRLRAVVSFNYDMTVETCLQLAGARPRHVAVEHHRGNIPVMKLHGSANYDAAPAWLTAPHSYPISNFFEDIDCPLVVLPDSALRSVRTMSYLVLPAEASLYRGHRNWVLPCFEELKVLGHDCRRVVVAGLSYWDVDRPEIDDVLSSISPEASAVVIDPSPNADLLDVLTDRFTRVEVLRDGP